MAVLVELDRGPDSGGHVKCWEHFAAAAADGDEVDLTIYTLGRTRGVEELSPNVRFVRLRPVLGTGGVGTVVGGVDRSDLAPYHPGLVRLLPRHDVWHLTHSMSFAGSALRARRTVPRPMVASVHTDVPTLTRLYTHQVVDRLPGTVRRLARRTGLAEVPERLARRRCDGILRACDRVLVSNQADRDHAVRLVPAQRISTLRRGIEGSLFGPGCADRERLAQRFGIPTGVPLALFVGRVDATKGARLVAQAVSRIRNEGGPVHLVVAGQGADEDRIAALLGDGVTLLGPVPHAELPLVYASCDVLVFPSLSETAGNVVAEAMAAGVPALLPRGARTCQWLASPGADGVLVDGHDVEAWSGALARLLDDWHWRTGLARRARDTSVNRHPTWEQVFHQDLLPVWRSCVAAEPGQPEGASSTTPGIGDVPGKSSRMASTPH